VGKPHDCPGTKFARPFRPFPPSEKARFSSLDMHIKVPLSTPFLLTNLLFPYSLCSSSAAGRDSTPRSHLPALEEREIGGDAQ